jgi:hypothetical protein
MLESLLEDPVAEAVINLVRQHTSSDWSGEPSELLDKLTFLAPHRVKYSREWPQNAIAMGKRLSSLKGGLLSQGIEVVLSRGKKRKVTITDLEAF